MHIDILTRGPKNRVDEFITQLRGVYLPWKVTKEVAGFKKGNYHFQVRVCPIQLWDISFPKEYLDTMLNTLLVNKGKTIHGKHQKFISMLRMGLGLNKIPDYKKNQYLPLKQSTAHIDLMGIGIKEDRDDDGTEML